MHKKYHCYCSPCLSCHGLWKCPNNSACTKGIIVFRMLQFNTIYKKIKNIIGQFLQWFCCCCCCCINIFWSCEHSSAENCMCRVHASYYDFVYSEAKGDQNLWSFTSFSFTNQVVQKTVFNFKGCNEVIWWLCLKAFQIIRNSRGVTENHKSHLNNWSAVIRQSDHTQHLLKCLITVRLTSVLPELSHSLIPSLIKIIYLREKSVVMLD